MMPRIRHWKELNLCRPPGEPRYLHFDSLFNTQAEWHLIETMLPDMLRVALSIKAGTIRPSTILRRLATYSGKNTLYFAFRELGRVVRTIFLLQYISDLELRQVSRLPPTKARPSTNSCSGCVSAARA
jgi:TnpA family transposase